MNHSFFFSAGFDISTKKTLENEHVDTDKKNMIVKKKTENNRPAQ